MSKYKELYKQNGLQLEYSESKRKEYLGNQKFRRNLVVDGKRDRDFVERKVLESRNESRAYKKIRITAGQGETSAIKSQPRPFVVGVVKHKIHSPPFLHGPRNQEACDHSVKPRDNSAYSQSFAPRNYKFNAPKGLDVQTPALPGNATPFTFDSIFRGRNQKNVKRRRIDFENITMRSKNVRKSPKNSPLATITNTLPLQTEESEGKCIFGRLNSAKELNRSGSSLSSDSTRSFEEQVKTYTFTPIFDGKKIPLFDSTAVVKPKEGVQDDTNGATPNMKYTSINKDILRSPKKHNAIKKSLNTLNSHKVSSDDIKSVPTFSRTILPEERIIDTESSHFENIDLSNSVLNIENTSIYFTSPTLCRTTNRLKSSPEIVPSDEEMNIIPESEETTLHQTNFINGVEKQLPIFSEVIYDPFKNITIRECPSHNVLTAIQKKDILTNHVEIETRSSYSESVENSSPEITAVLVGNLSEQTESRTQKIDPAQNVGIEDVANFPVSSLFLNKRDQCDPSESFHSDVQRNSSSNTSIPQYLFEISTSSFGVTKTCTDTLQSLQSEKEKEKKLDKSISDDYSDSFVKDQINDQHLNENQVNIAELSSSQQDTFKENTEEVNMSFDESSMSAQTSMKRFNTLPDSIQESRTIANEKVSNFELLNCTEINKDKDVSVDSDIPLHSFGLSDSFFNTSKPQVGEPLFGGKINEKVENIKLIDCFNTSTKKQTNDTVRVIQQISADKNSKSFSENLEKETASSKESTNMDNDIIMNSSICLPLIFAQESLGEIPSLSVLNDTACSIVDQAVNKDLDISIPLNFFKLNKNKTLMNEEQALNLETMKRISNIENNSFNAGMEDKSNTIDEVEYENMNSVTDKSEDKSSKTQEVTSVASCKKLPREEVSPSNSDTGKFLNEGKEKSDIVDRLVLSSISLVPRQYELASVDRNESIPLSEMLEDQLINHIEAQITICPEKKQSTDETVENIPDSISITEPHNTEMNCQETDSFSEKRMDTVEEIPTEKISEFQLIVEVPENSPKNASKMKEVKSLAPRLDKTSPNLVINLDSSDETKLPIVVPKLPKIVNGSFSNFAENEAVDIISDDEEDYQSFLSHVLAIHAPTVILSPASPKMSTRRAHVLEVTSSTDSPRTCKTPTKSVKKMQNRSPAPSPLLKSNTKRDKQNEVNKATPVRLLQLRSRNISVSPFPTQKIALMKITKGGQKSME